MAWGFANIQYLKMKHISAIGMWPHYNKFKQKIPKIHRITNRNLYIKVVIEIFKTIAFDVVNNRGGVAIKNLGYFFVFRSPKKRIASYVYPDGTSEMYYNQKKDARYIEPMFYPVKERHLPPYCWSMDNSYVHSIAQSVKENVYAGKKYKNYIYTVQKLKLI